MAIDDANVSHRLYRGEAAWGLTPRGAKRNVLVLQPDRAEVHPFLRSMGKALDSRAE